MSIVHGSDAPEYGVTAMSEKRLTRERTDRGTTFTFPGGTKYSFSDVQKSELHEALEKLYTFEQALAEGRLVMVPRVGDDIGEGGGMDGH